MSGQTTERAFEMYGEETLVTRGGWKSGSNAAVERLQEYRTALIIAAVTVKIEVRGGVAKSPEKRVTSASP